MQRRDLYPSPLYLERLQGVDDLNAELRTRLLAEARSQPGRTVSNVGGWHSEHDLLGRPDPCFQAVGKLMLAGFRKVLADAGQRSGRPPGPAHAVRGVAWAMVMEAGGYSRPHHHGEAHWAGVYYVDAGDAAAPPPAGCLSFIDPRGALQGGDPLGLFQDSHDIRPVDGLLLFFPGWLVHHVHPYPGTRPRVSIACNLQVG